MENLVMKNLFGGIYKGTKVLVTGHTGFKGSWLSYWLHNMGAEVYGIALEPDSDPSHFNLLKFPAKSFILNINEKEKLAEKVKEIGPEIIFHLAAQPLVRLSYEKPIETLMTNIMGTANLLEASRNVDSLKAIVIITSDKCYDNKEWVWGYRENDPLGGKDPYSASKGCTEIISAAYRHSYFNPEKYGSEHHVLIATARAGNVIGGGDWAPDRIVPDMVKTAAKKEKVYLRYPGATRPWQHVLEPLSGYLCLGWHLLEGKKEFTGGWNFGPDLAGNVTVLELVKNANKVWSDIIFDFNHEPQPHEAGFLMLDSSKARKLLKWEPFWDFKETVGYTIDWYKSFYINKQLNTLSDLRKFILKAYEKGYVWTI